MRNGARGISPTPGTGRTGMTRRGTRFVGLLLFFALGTGLAAPALCAPTGAAAMPCCEVEGDCGQGIGRPSCCVDLPADGGAPFQPAASGAQGALAALTPPTAPAEDGLPELPQLPAAIDPASTSDTPPLFLLHSVFLC